MLDYLQHSMDSYSKGRKEFTLNGRGAVFVKDQLPEHVDLQNVLYKIEKILPSWVIDEVDVGYVGHFDIFDEMNFNSVFENGAIYISNNQDNEEDMLDDLAHEAAHAIEIPYGHMIYDSGKLESEFLQKRMKLFQLLKSQGYEISNARNLFLNIEFNQEFDNFLYKEVNYDLLDNLLIGVFVRPYAAASINEYFAIGFVEYYMGDRIYLSEICPKLYKILNELEEQNNEL